MPFHFLTILFIEVSHTFHPLEDFFFLTIVFLALLFYTLGDDMSIFPANDISSAISSTFHLLEGDIHSFSYDNNSSSIISRFKR